MSRSGSNPPSPYQQRGDGTPKKPKPPANPPPPIGSGTCWVCGKPDSPLYVHVFCYSVEH